MSEDGTTHKTLSQIRERAELVGAQISGSVMAGLEGARHLTSAGRLALLLAAGAAGIVGVQIVFYFQSGAWQMLVVAASAVAAVVLMVVAYRYIRRERLDLAGYCAFLGLLIAYWGGELALSGLTLYFALGGVLLILVVGKALLPRRWGVWLATAALHGGIILLLNWWEPLSRYNATLLTPLVLLIAGVTVLSGVVVVWQFFRLYRGLGTIRARLSVSFVLVGLLPVVVISTMLVVVGSQYGRQQAIGQLEAMTKVKEAEIERWVDNLRVDLETALMSGQAAQRAVVLLQTSEPLSSQEFWMRGYLRQTVDLVGRIEELSLIDLQGEVVLSTDTAREGEDCSDETYFQEGMKEFYFQPLVYSTSLGRAFTYVACPVVDRGGEAVGVLSGRVNPTTLEQILGEQAWLGETGEIYLVDRNRIPVTPLRFGEGGETRVGTVGANAALESRRNGAGVYDNYRGVPVVGVYRWLPELQVALLAEQNQDEALRITTSMLQVVGFVAAVALAVAVVMSLLVTRSIAGPLTNLTETAVKIASGELELVAQVEGNDEVGMLAQAFNGMTTRLRDMLRGEQSQRERLQTTVQEYAEYMAQVGQGDLKTRLLLDGDGRGADDPLVMLGQQLNETTASLHRMILQIRDAAGELSSAGSEIMAATTQQVSGASEQSAAISQTTTTVDQVKTIAEQSVARAQEVADASQRTVQVSRTGRQAVEETIASMQEIKAQVEGIAENILGLSEQTQQVGEIIATVKDIAAQSNMLALNASIEAARAGEYGKGFAVVAVEVRNLAEQSKQATEQVRAILSDIQKATNATVMATEEGTKRVEEGMRLATQAGGAIRQLGEVIEESAQAAVQMVAGGRQQAAGMEQIAVAMQNINQATAQSLSSTRQAEKAAQDLNDLARSLTEIVERYQL